MLICFFDSQGVVHKEFVPQGQADNQQYYREVLERLRKMVHRVRPENADTWMLHHDNAHRHTAISLNEFLTKIVFQWSLTPIFTWSESVWLLPFPKTQIPPQRSSLRNRGQHFHMKTSCTATGSWSNVSGCVWLPKGTILKGIMLICSSVVNTKNYSTSHITF